MVFTDELLLVAELAWFFVGYAYATPDGLWIAFASAVALLLGVVIATFATSPTA